MQRAAGRTLRPRPFFLGPTCTAVEGSYGFGLAPGSAEANTFLAGGQTFKADAVEVWQVQ